MDISPPGYTFHRRPRPIGRGGGVGFLTIPPLNICVLTYQIRASLGISVVFIALQVTQLISSKNSRIFWKMLQPCTQHFKLLANLIFTWIHHLQQLPRLMIFWHQHVRFPPHIHGHWLDILITRSSCINLSYIHSCRWLIGQ